MSMRSELLTPPLVDPLHPHEDLGRAVVSEHCGAEGIEEELGIGIDDTTGKDHRVLGMRREVGGNGERMGHDHEMRRVLEMHHAEDGRAAVHP